MKISPLNNIILPRRRYQYRQAAPSFQSSDTVEFSSSVLPKKLELTEFEAKYNDVMIQVKRLDSNIYVQKNNLKDYYSALKEYPAEEMIFCAKTSETKTKSKSTPEKYGKKIK